MNAVRIVVGLAGDGQWTHRLIPKIRIRLERKTGETNYHITQYYTEYDSCCRSAPLLVGGIAALFCMQWHIGGCRACDVLSSKVRDGGNEPESSVRKEREPGQYIAGDANVEGMLVMNVRRRKLRTRSMSAYRQTHPAVVARKNKGNQNNKRSIGLKARVRQPVGILKSLMRVTFSQNYFKGQKQHRVETYIKSFIRANMHLEQEDKLELEVRCAFLYIENVFDNISHAEIKNAFP